MAERKRSTVWRNFTPLDRDKARCDICRNEYSHKGGSTTNLLRHLAHKHREIRTVLTDRIKDKWASAKSKTNESAPGCSSAESPTIIERRSDDSIIANARIHRIKANESTINDKLQFLCQDSKIETEYIVRDDDVTTDNDEDQDDQDDIIKHEALLMEVVTEDPLNENSRMEIQYVDQHPKKSKFKSQPKPKRSVDVNSMYEIQKFLKQDADSHDDEDSTFFRSILPAVRKLTEDQKLEFKGEVLSSLRKIKQKNQFN